MYEDGKSPSNSPSRGTSVFFEGFHALRSPSRMLNPRFSRYFRDLFAAVMFALPYPGATRGGFVPSGQRRQIASPKRKIAALRRAHLVNRAPFVKKGTMPVGKIIPRRIGIAKRHHVFPNDRLAVNISRRFQIVGQSVEFLGIEINNPRFSATAFPAPSARKIKTVAPKSFNLHNHCQYSELFSVSPPRCAGTTDDLLRIIRPAQDRSRLRAHRDARRQAPKSDEQTPAAVLGSTARCMRQLSLRSSTHRRR